jgi:hypothetical protein
VGVHPPALQEAAFFQACEAQVDQYLKKLMGFKWRPPSGLKPTSVTIRTK